MALELTHWEYSFLMHTCNLGDQSGKATNPFTGETIEFPMDYGLTREEIDAIQDIFDENGVDGPDPDGEGYVMRRIQSESLRFLCYDLDAAEPIAEIAVEVIVKDLPDQVLTLILDVARAGNLALTSSVGDSVRIPGKKLSAEVKKRWPDAQSLSSISELRQWLQDSIGGRQVHVPY